MDILSRYWIVNNFLLSEQKPLVDFYPVVNK
jgi:hypothetical protein